MSKERIGIYGGTFSPPHNGHRRALEAFLRQERLDRVYVIPTLIPPHKQLKDDADADARLEMCRLAFGDLPVTVSDMEIKRGGKSYTVLTLEELKTEDNTLILLCGTDMFLTLEEWHMPARIFELAEIVYVQREAGKESHSIAQKLKERSDILRQKYNAVTRPLQCDSLMMSSSQIRNAIKNNEDTATLLSPTVRRYIDQCHLYR